MKAGSDQKTCLGESWKSKKKKRCLLRAGYDKQIVLKAGNYFPKQSLEQCCKKNKLSSDCRNWKRVGNVLETYWKRKAINLAAPWPTGSANLADREPAGVRSQGPRRPPRSLTPIAPLGRGRTPTDHRRTEAGTLAKEKE